MTRGERRAEKATRRVAKARRRSNIKSIWLLINARRKREAGETMPPRQTTPAKRLRGPGTTAPGPMRPQRNTMKEGE